MSKINPNSIYIGDGLYASFDGTQIWLQAYDGINVYNEVALEPHTLANFEEYVKELRHKKINI